MIRNNSHKYSILAMCEVLEISRSTYYYEAEQRDNQEQELTKLIVQIFKESHNIYGQRKIKVELQKLGWQVSRRRISLIMKEHISLLVKLRPKGILDILEQFAI